MPSLNEGIVRHIPVVRPHVRIQRAIASVLERYDDKIELNRQLNETLEALARAVFKSWFVDFDPVRAKIDGRQPHGMNAETAKLFPDRFEHVDGELVPAGWSTLSVEDLCESISSGGTPARRNAEYWDDGHIPWFKTGELLDGPLTRSSEAITEIGLKESSCKLWPAGTILFALYASPTVGRLGVLSKPGTSNQAAAGLIVDDAVGVEYLRHSLLNAREELQRISAGAAQQNINQTILRRHRALHPTRLLMGCFSVAMQHYFDLQLANQRESQTLAELRDTLLPKLLSGELSVPAAEELTEEMA